MSTEKVSKYIYAQEHKLYYYYYQLWGVSIEKAFSIRNVRNKK